MKLYCMPEIWAFAAHVIANEARIPGANVAKFAEQPEHAAWNGRAGSQSI
jgi:hypothetical protein